MLYPAQLYREELKCKLIECWYKPEYDYYFMGEYSEFNVCDNAYWRTDLVHLDENGEVDGYFSYQKNDAAKSISQFGLISFTGKGGALVWDCIQHIDKLVSEGLHRMEWWAVSDNPANKIYKKLIKRYGGRIAGRMRDCNYFGGKYHDSVMYEIIFGEEAEDMYVGGRWMTETETQAYIKKITAERDKYKEQLIETLEAAATCKGVAEDTDNCVDCLYFDRKKANEPCPSSLSQYTAKLLLEEILGKSHTNIC